jgi:outer membrane autotransporter protein
VVKNIKRDELSSVQDLKPLAKAITTVCASMTLAYLPPAIADSCTTAGTTTISSVTSDPCQLGNDGGLDLNLIITASGGLTGTDEPLLFVAAGDSAGSITNSGTIELSDYYAAVSLGAGASLSGAITNNAGAIIRAFANTYSSTPMGIYNSGTITGGIDNSGLIEASLSYAYITGGEVYGVYNYSTGTIGGITNSGTIRGLEKNTTSYLYDAYAFGIHNSGDITGAIDNSGTIEAQFSAVSSAYYISYGYAYGIYNYSAGTIGSVSNSGTIGGYLNRDATSGGSSYIYAGFGYGIYNSGEITGAVDNNGVIEAKITATVGYVASGYAYGIYNYNDGEIGSITNSGTIKADVNSPGSSSSYVSNGYAYGINNSGSIAGGITNNAGAIISANVSAPSSYVYNGFAYGVLNDGSITGNITNDGTIKATIFGTDSSGYGNYAYGIKNDDSIDGSIVNNGQILASISSSYLYSNYAYGIRNDGSITGDITNSGTIAAKLHDSYEFSSISKAGAWGIYNRGGVEGDVTNTGLIDVDVTLNASEAYSVYAYGITNDGSIGGNLTNNGTINADLHISNTMDYLYSVGAYGIKNTGSISGNLTNTGLIHARAVVDKLDPTATGSYMYAYGIYNSDDIDGGVNNTGTIEAGIEIDNYLYQGTAAGIYNTGSISAASPAITNSGTINATISVKNATSASSLYAYGIYNNDLIDGDISNSGQIKASVSVTGAAAGSSRYAYGIYNDGSIAGGIINSGMISATASSSAAGIYVNSADISAGITNNAGGVISGSTFGINIINPDPAGDNEITVVNEGSIDSINIDMGTLNISGEGLTGALTGNSTSALNILNTFTSGGDISNFTMVTVLDNATFNLNNDVSVTGSFDVGEGASGTLNVGANSVMATGAFSLNAGSTFGTTINSATQDDAGNLTVTGASTIDNSLTVNVTAAVPIVAGTTYTIIDSGSGTTDAVGLVTDDSAGFFFTADLTDGDLVLTANTFVGDLVINDDEILNSASDSEFLSVTIGGGISGILNHSGGTLITDSVIINAAGTYTQSATGILNATNTTIGDGGTMTLVNQGAGAIDGAAAQEGDLIFAGDYDTDSAIGDTNSLSSVTVNDGATLTVDQNLEANAVNVGQGTSGVLNQSAGTLATATLTINNGGTYTQSGTGVINATDIGIGTGNTLVLANQGTGVIDGLAAGTGALVFAGDYNTDTAIGANNSLSSVTVNAGVTLTLDQSIISTTLAVNGILNSADGGSITSSASILSGGAMKVGSNSTSITGSFNLEAGATFYTTVNSGESNDAGSVVVDGNANVSADAIVMVSVSENAVVSEDTSYIIIDATGGDINAPTMVLDDSDDLTFRATADGTDLLITASLGNELEALIEDLGTDTLSDNAEAVLAPLVALVNEDPELAAALAAVTTVEEFEEVLASLAPDVSAAVQTATQTAGRSAVVTVLNRLTALRTGLGDMTGLAAGDQFSEVTSWVQAFGSTADQNDRGGVAGFDIDSRGITFGMDSAVTTHLRLGAAFSYSTTDVDTKGFNNKTDIDTYQGTLYGSLNHPDWYLDGSLSYAWSNSEGRRNIAFGALNRTALADYDSNQFIAQATFGKDFRLDNDMIVNPYVGLEYVNLSTDDYTETGAGTLNLAVDSANTSSLKSTVGVSIRKAFESGEDYTIMPEAHIGWRYDFLDEAQLSTSNFAGSGTAFNTQGLNPADSSFNIGGTMSVYSTGNTEFQLKYDFQTMSDYAAHSGFLVFRYRF